MPLLKVQRGEIAIFPKGMPLLNLLEQKDINIAPCEDHIQLIQCNLLNKYGLRSVVFQIAKPNLKLQM
jgi:hypothetical protein